MMPVPNGARGLLYKNNRETVARVRNKRARQKLFAKEFLPAFEQVRFQFWSPVVPRGYLTENLAKLDGLELIINGEYKARVEEFQALASEMTHDARNPVFRVLQILGHLRG